MRRPSEMLSMRGPQTIRSVCKLGIAAAIGLICAEALSGCLVAGYSTTGGFFLWPGSIGLIVVLLLLFLLLRRNR